MRLRWTNDDAEKHAGRAGRGGGGLRLVGQGSRTSKGAEAAKDSTSPVQDHTDPRWVLAVRTSEALQGSVLSPERREKLIRLARTFGLTAFDGNMIIAMVQDQARRGRRPDLGSPLGPGQLDQIPHPDQRRAQQRRLQTARPWQIAWWCAAILTAELLTIYLML